MQRVGGRWRQRSSAACATLQLCEQINLAPWLYFSVMFFCRDARDSSSASWRAIFCITFPNHYCRLHVSNCAAVTTAAAREFSNDSRMSPESTAVGGRSRHKPVGHGDRCVPRALPGIDKCGAIMRSCSRGKLDALTAWIALIPPSAREIWKSRSPASFNAHSITSRRAHIAGKVGIDSCIAE